MPTTRSRSTKGTARVRLKTYAESRRCAPFDWAAFLQRETFTRGELTQAQARAGAWVTCACGNQCSLLPREADEGAPLDDQLHRLGMSFYKHVLSLAMSHAEDCHVNEGERRAALKTLARIEARSTKLLTAMGVVFPTTRR